MLRASALLATAAAGLLLTACGGDSSSTTTTLSRSAYIARADAICATVDQAIRAIPTPRTTNQLVASADKTLAITEPAVRRLRALDPPADFAADARTMVDGIAEQVVLIRRLREAAVANDVRQIEAIGSSGKRASAQLGVAATKAGFKHCGIGRTS